MAANTHGSASFPVTIKTTVVTTKDVKTTTTEKVYDSKPDDVALTDGVVSFQTEPYGGGFYKQTVVTEANATQTLPATTYESQGSMTELPIQQHPDFDTWSSEWDEAAGAFKSSSDKYGVTSYIVGSVTVTKTEYFATQPTDRYASVGTLEAPGGSYSGANKWLIIGTARRKVSDTLYTRETQYLYSAKGFDTDIYS